MSHCLTYSILQQRMMILGFEPYVAPDNFDRKAQPVDIYDVFERYYRNHRDAKWIYTVEDSWTYPTNLYGGTSYRYGYKSGGVNYTNDILFNGYTTLSSTVSGTVTSIMVTSTENFPDAGIVCLIDGLLNTQKEYFTYTSKDSTHFYGSSQTFTKTHSQGVYYSIDWGTSTNRWVITNNTSISPMICYSPYFTGAMEWLYIGKGVKGLAVGSAGGNTCRLKYIHINKLSDITDYGGISRTYSHYGASGGGAWGIAGRLTGTLHISGSATIIPLASFIVQSLITKVVINEGVQTISSDVFKGDTGLDGTLTIPNTCTEIGASAFNNCNKLDTLDLGTGVITIGNSAFQACAQLTGTLTIPNSVTLIDQYAFESVPKITAVYSYPSTAPTIGTNGLTLGGTARPLHIPLASSGYDVPPWTDTSIFSSIINDL